MSEPSFSVHRFLVIIFLTAVGTLYTDIWMINSFHVS